MGSTTPPLSVSPHLGDLYAHTCSVTSGASFKAKTLQVLYTLHLCWTPVLACPSGKQSWYFGSLAGSVCSLSSNKRFWPVNREAEGVCPCPKRQHFNTELGTDLNRRNGWGHIVGQLCYFPALGVWIPKWAVVMRSRGWKGKPLLSPRMPSSIY